MRFATSLVIGAGIAAIVLVASAPHAIGAPPDDAGSEGGMPACVKVTTEARYVPGGYNHIVTIANGCAKTASCVISTDVNPQQQTAVVPPASTSELLTFMASPASTFVARVSCALK